MHHSTNHGRPQRLAILAQWSESGGIPPHVRIHLQRLRPNCARVVLVSNSALDQISRALGESLCDRVLERSNAGFDFSAWRDALRTEDTAEWDEIVLTNSSVVGPVFPLEGIFEEMVKRPVDFWGMTGSNWGRPHIQSYFLVFRKRLIASSAWTDYWDDVHDVPKKKDVTRRYELPLRDRLERQNFVGGTFVPLEPSLRRGLVFRRPNARLPLVIPISAKKADPTIFAPYELLLRGMPYLKASLVWTHHRYRRCPMDAIKSIRGIDYPWREIGL